LGDEKTAEEVIIPTSEGIKEVPALHFSYFDTFLKDYKTITQGPFAIQSWRQVLIRILRQLDFLM